MGWLNAVFQGISRISAQPEPHPNEGLRDRSKEPLHTDQILRAAYEVVVPVGQAGAMKLYGDPGKNGGTPDKAWERENMVVARDLPGTWNNSPSGKCKLYVHKKIEAPLREALTRLERADRLADVESVGCFVFRRIRHQKTGPLSYHSWGVAVDLNAAKNFGVVEHPKYLSRQNQPVPEPFSEGWRKIWPEGLNEDVVAAFEACGAEWGGRWSGYVDPMHFQWVRTK